MSVNADYWSLGIRVAVLVPAISKTHVCACCCLPPHACVLLGDPLLLPFLSFLPSNTHTSPPPATHAHPHPPTHVRAYPHPFKPKTKACLPPSPTKIFGPPAAMGHFPTPQLNPPPSHAVDASRAASHGAGWSCCATPRLNAPTTGGGGVVCLRSSREANSHAKSISRIDIGAEHDAAAAVMGVMGWPGSDAVGPSVAFGRRFLEVGWRVGFQRAQRPPPTCVPPAAPSPPFPRWCK